MVHGYHLILPMYGFWLPNDPRGSWSDYVRSWELANFGKSTHQIERTALQDLTPTETRHRAIAKKALKFPAVCISGTQAAGIGRGFSKKISLSGYTVWACAILPEHTHLVVARHSYEIEKIANLLKGAATRELKDHNLHPLSGHKRPDGKMPPMWAGHQWAVFLDSANAIDEAINYVELNPEKEGKPRQQWSFVSPFLGITQNAWSKFND
jgi:REP element-mobilizing transposase RayT